MAEQAEKIVSVEILHLDELGYGPEGKHTRREWRAECLENLLAGKVQFEEWQQRSLKKFKHNSSLNYDVFVTYDDGIEQLITCDGYLRLDFLGQIFASVIADDFDFILKANFEYAIFLEGASFINAIFTESALFKSAIFGEFVWFNNALFKEGAVFDAATFAEPVNFGSATFEEYSEFNATTFSKFAWFKDTVFSESTSFATATFSENAWFDNAIFSGEVWFYSATFSGIASFDSVTFSNDIDFSRVKFEESSYFRKTTFKGFTEFRGTNFFKQANFENTVFENVGHFEGARFFELFPAFRGCKIDSTRIEFSDDNHFPEQDFSEDAIKNISFLKRLSDEHGQTDQALNFNAMELRAKLKLGWQNLKPQNHQDAKLLNSHLSWRVWIRLSNLFRSDFCFCIFTWLYEKISDFGRSYTRPLFLLLVLMVMSYLFGIVSAFENSPAKFTHSRQPIFEELERSDFNSHNESKEYLKISAYRAAMEYSLYRSSNFLDFTDADKNTTSINMRLFGSEIEPWWARVFGFVKGIATAILLFLIALGLRNKYRVS